MPYFIFNDGSEKKSIELLSDRPLNIGRSKLNDLAFLGNEKISRQHASVFIDPVQNAYIVRDLGSTNGTFINGRRINEDVVLREGDKLGIGGILLVFKYEEGNDTQRMIRIKQSLEKPLSIENLQEAELTSTVSEYEEKKINDLFPSAKNGAFHYVQGELIDRLEVVRPFSETPNAIAYLVREQGNQDFKVMKVFKRDFSDNQNAVKDFFAAVQKADIGNPFFVKYYEVGTRTGCCFLTMDYFQNGNLTTRIVNGSPFSEIQALYVTLNTAIALNNAFLNGGCAHQNLKPSNILYGLSENIIVADYGLAEWTSKYVLGGKPAISPYYISPEQVSGRKSDWSSDLYSLGIIFFQMLTGVLPFHSANTEEIPLMHVKDAFPSPGERNSSVKVSINSLKLLSRMTAKNPADRFTSWADFITAAQPVYDELYKKESTSISLMPPDSEKKAEQKKFKIFKRKK